MTKFGIIALVVNNFSKQYMFVQGYEWRQLCMHSFRLARDPTQGVLPDPYLGQGIGPMPGYGVSFHAFWNLAEKFLDNFWLWSIFFKKIKPRPKSMKVTRFIFHQWETMAFIIFKD